MDGIHILLSTLSSDADESSMRKEAVKVGARRLRKRQLEQVEGQYHHQNQHTYRSAAAAADSPASSYASSFSYLKEKLALGLNLASAGILHDVLERMQLHLRNVHIRWEGEFTFRFIVLVEFLFSNLWTSIDMSLLPFLVLKVPTFILGLCYRNDDTIYIFLPLLLSGVY